MLRLLNFPLMVIFIVFFITNIKVEITRVQLNETRFSLTRIIRNITTGLFGLDSALKKVIPIYLGPKKVVPDISWPQKSGHYFDALNEREIVRFASIHGRVCFNRWKEHPYIVQQYTPKSTQK